MHWCRSPEVSHIRQVLHVSYWSHLSPVYSVIILVTPEEKLCMYVWSENSEMGPNHCSQCRWLWSGPPSPHFYPSCPRKLWGPVLNITFFFLHSPGWPHTCHTAEHDHELSLTSGLYPSGDWDYSYAPHFYGVLGIKPGVPCLLGILPTKLFSKFFV